MAEEENLSKRKPASYRWGRVRRLLPILDVAIRAGVTQAVWRAAKRWRVIRDPARFNGAELFGPRGRAQVHDVREGRVVLRHRTRDIEIFDEIFVGTSAYEPPPRVAAALSARPPRSVLDLGGNIGLFGVYALSRWPVSSVTSVEPDPSNIPLLTRCVAANDAGGRWHVIQAAAASRPGALPFAAGNFADSSIALEGEQATAQVIAVDAFELFPQADLAKIDIEGGEWDLLLDSRFADAAPDVIVMEWHQRGCPNGDAYSTVLNVFQQAGYKVEGEAIDGLDCGTLWAWRSPGSRLTQPR